MPRTKYGLPFRGYVSSVPRFQTGPDALTAASRDWLVDPSAGRLLRRKGSQMVGDDIRNNVGLLDAKWSARARQMMPLSSNTLTDGYPTHASLFSDESLAFGQLGFYSTNPTFTVTASVNSKLDFKDGAGPSTYAATLAAADYTLTTNSTTTNICAEFHRALNAAHVSTITNWCFCVVTGFNDLLRFTTGAGSFLVTLTAGVYSQASLAALVQTKMNQAQGAPDITCSFNSSTNKCTIAKGSGTLTLNCTTTATGAYALLGFNTATDKSGALTYTGSFARKENYAFVQFIDGNNGQLLPVSGANVTPRPSVSGWDLLQFTTDRTGASDYLSDRQVFASGTNIVPGREFQWGYPANGSGSALRNNFKMVPQWTSSAQVYSRAVNEVQRRMMACGSRRALRVHDQVYFPNLEGTPSKWNTLWYDQRGRQQKERHFPTGHVPPLYLPTLSKGTSGTATEPWLGSDRFAYSVVFKHKDGSYSMPFIPRNLNTYITAAAYGIFTVDSANPTTRYKSITWNDIPIGPTDDVEARLLCRSTKVSSAGTTGDTLVPSFVDLRICAYIPNNTQVTYVDTGGNDANLIADGTIVRFDHKWPDCARYIAAFDERIIVGYLKPNPCAIALCQHAVASGTVTPRSDRNYDDNTIGSKTASFAVRDNETSGSQVLNLVLVEDSSYPSAPIVLSSSVSVQDVVDQMLATTTATTTTAIGDWKGQIVPGADSLATTDNLQLTQVFTKCKTNSNTSLTLVPGVLTNIAVGMVVQETNATGSAIVTTNIPNSGLTVTAVSGATVTISGNASTTTAGATVYVKFGWDMGDAVPGEYRVFGNSNFGVVHFNSAYRATYPTSKRSVLYTGANPGHARNAADNYYVGNRRTLEERAGILMGIAPLLSGAVLPCSRGIGVIRNLRGGKSGEDNDYRAELLNQARGCISWGSVVSGNGWVGYLTSEGYVVTDGQEERIISRDVWNATTRMGDWAYEISQCEAGANGDNDLGRFHASVLGGRIYCSFRSSATVTVPDRQLIYDFSSEAPSSGLAEVLRDDGSSFGWSCALTLTGSPACEVAKSDGIHRYLAIEDNAGATGDGRVDEFEFGPYDISKTRTVLHCSASGQSVITTVNDGFLGLTEGTLVVSSYYPAGTFVRSVRSEIEILLSANASSSYTDQSLTFYGIGVAAVAYTSTDMLGTAKQKSLNKIYALTRKVTSETVSGMTIGVARNKGAVIYDVLNVKPANAADVYVRQPIEMPMFARGPRESVEFYIADNGTGAVQPEVYGIEADVEVLEFSER